MSVAEDARLAWYRRACQNLRKYLEELEAARDALRRRGNNAHPADQLIAEVRRRLQELEKLLAERKPD
jgi:uncharacterized protein YukE